MKDYNKELANIANEMIAVINEFINENGEIDLMEIDSTFNAFSDEGVYIIEVGFGIVVDEYGNHHNLDVLLLEDLLRIVNVCQGMKFVK